MSYLPLQVLLVRRFVTGSSANDLNDRFIYNPNNGRLFFDIDGSRVNSKVQFASLNSGLALTNQNILVV